LLLGLSIIKGGNGMARPKASTLSKLQPAPGYVVVEPAETVQKTKSGIYLPDSHDEKPQEGKVLVVGGVWVTEQGAKISPPCKKGQTVIYKKWGGNEVKIEDTEYQFLKFEDILAVVS
jgi:chaperonin GroES